MLWVGDYRRSMVLLFVAGATDALDGYLARRFDWTSRLGAYLDPVGDKLLLVSVYVTLGLRETVPVWLMGLVLGRDALILGLVAVAFWLTSVRSFPPSLLGKLSTVVQVMAGLAIVAGHAYFPRETAAVDGIAIPAVATATIASGSHYVYLAARQFRALPPESRK